MRWTNGENIWLTLLTVPYLFYYISALLPTHYWLIEWDPEKRERERVRECERAGPFQSQSSPSWRTDLTEQLSSRLLRINQSLSTSNPFTSSASSLSSQPSFILVLLPTSSSSSTTQSLFCYMLNQFLPWFINLSLNPNFISCSEIQSFTSISTYLTYIHHGSFVGWRISFAGCKWLVCGKHPRWW